MFTEISSYDFKVIWFYIMKTSAVFQINVIAALMILRSRLENRQK